MGLFQLCVLCMDLILWHGPLSEGVGFLESHLNGETFTKLSLHSWNASQVTRSFVCVAEIPTDPQEDVSAPPPSRQTHGPGALTWLLVAAALIRLVCARQCSKLGTQSLAFAASTTVLATVWKRKQQVLNMPGEHHTAL